MQTYLSATRRFSLSAFFLKFLGCDVAMRDADVSDGPRKPCSALAVAGRAQRRSWRNVQGGRQEAGGTIQI